MNMVLNCSTAIFGDVAFGYCELAVMTAAAAVKASVAGPTVAGRAGDGCDRCCPAYSHSCIYLQDGPAYNISPRNYVSHYSILFSSTKRIDVFGVKNT